MTSRMPVLIAAVAGVLGGAIVGGSALIGASAASSPSTPEPATSGPSAHLHGDRPCGAGWAQLPDDLRAALKAARALPQGERRVAMAQIRKDAVAGKYGETAQKFAEKRGQHRAQLRQQLPDDLRAALKAARALPQGERRVAMEQIRKDAVAGKYGETAQKLAEKRSAHRQHRRDTCSPSPTQS